MIDSKPWNLEILPVGPLQMNSVLLTAQGPNGGEAILFDPGEEAPRLLARIEASGCKLTHLLATHCHFDHIGAGAAIQAVHDLPLICHSGAVPIIEHLQSSQTMWGFSATETPRYQADLADGDMIAFAGQEITVRYVPGHSPGQVMYVLPGISPVHALVGDCIFHNGVGRTDLPGGDFPTLEKSIRECIYTLPDETVIVPGHGPDTTVGHEKATNPFVRP
jgi:hydroxyacylglutathione hydrolase